MAGRRCRPTPEGGFSEDWPIEEWPYRGEELLAASRSGKVRMTCKWFRYLVEMDCIPVLTCPLD